MGRFVNLSISFHNSRVRYQANSGFLSFTYVSIQMLNLIDTPAKHEYQANTALHCEIEFGKLLFRKEFSRIEAT